VKERLLDILACPHDQHWPLVLFTFEKRELKNSKVPKKNEKTGVVCSFYCARKKTMLGEEKSSQAGEEQPNYEIDCQECFSEEITAGILKCPKCEQYYPIISEIAVMVAPELRKAEVEKEFTEKWAEKIKKALEAQKDG